MSISLCALGAASAEVALPCAYEDKACASETALKHPAWTIAFWQSNLTKPLEQRIGPPPPELVEFLHLGVILAGEPNRPRAAAPDPDFLRDVQAAIAELPEAIRRSLHAKLAGVFLVEDIGGSAWGDQIFDGNRNPVAGMLALNVSALRSQTANSWATWKENTPFEPHAGFRLTLEIARESENNRKNAIQYLLLHELGHVFAIGNNVHPSWNLAPREVRSTSEFPYFLLSWAVSRKDSRYVTSFDSAIFPQRKDVHTVLMNRPFAIKIYRDGLLAKTYNACWGEPRCAEKRRILERVIQRESGRSSALE